MVTKIGIDLGYANITLSDINAEVYREPSVVLVDKNTRRVLSIGSRAAQVEEGEERGSAILVRPFKNGLLYHSDLTREIVSNIVDAVKPAENIRCLIALPSDIHPKQETELLSMLTAAGASECYSVKRGLAALIGAGYSPTTSAISVNIGASATEITVLYRGSIFKSVCEKVGGEDFDRAVKTHIFNHGDMNVSLLVARTIKERLGAVWKGKESETIEIEGSLAMTGSRVKMSISTEDIVGVFQEPLRNMIFAVAKVVKSIPVEYVKEIFANGIILSGGGAQLYGLDKMMEQVLGVKVVLCPYAIDAVAKGLSRIHTFLPVKKQLMMTKNISSQIAKFYEAKKK